LLPRRLKALTECPAQLEILTAQKGNIRKGVVPAVGGEFRKC